MFELTQEQQMLQDTLHRFLADQPQHSWADLAELGVMAALFDETAGGLGGSGTDIAIMFEELGRTGAALPLIDTVLIPGILMTAAGHDIKNLITGQQKTAFAHSELAARYDLNWVETKADNGLLTGEKTVVIGAQESTNLIVSARSQDSPDNASGIDLWLVNTDADGLAMNGYETATGERAADVSLNNTKAERLMENALPTIEDAIAAAIIAQTAQTLGAMETATEMTRDYLATREQFGRPIGSFQALAHRLTDMMIAVEQARSAVIMAAAHLTADRNERDRTLAATKNLIGRAGRHVAEEAIQMHGGIGMTQEYDLGRFAKRIVMADHRFGDTDHHLEKFIALGS